MTNLHLLVIDDDNQFYAAFREQYRSSYVFDYANHFERGLELIRKGGFDAVIIDLQFPPKSYDYGLNTILPRAVQLAKDRFPVLVASADERPGTLNKALKAGASLLFSKSEYDPEKWDSEIRRAVRKFKDPDTRKTLQAKEQTSGQDGFIAHSKAMQEIKLHLSKLVAYTHVAILIEGETGVGKEVAVQHLHSAKNNPDLPFIPINLVGLNEGSLERELFGHVKGAFTDADKDQPGYFETAQGGTLFLDEIGEISKGLQAKLLRVLEERSFQRLGSTKPIELKAQLVFATNVDLEKAMAEGKFRADFFERISGERIYIPPLRERREEIQPLIAHFFPQLFNHENHPFFGKNYLECFTPGALQILLEYDWPNNIRQLRNTLQKLIIAVDTKGKDIIDEELIPQQFKFPVRSIRPRANQYPATHAEDPSIAEHSWPLDKIKFYSELQEIDRALREAGGRKADAARSLGKRNDQNIRSRIIACQKKFPEVLDAFPILKKAYKL